MINTIGSELTINDVTLQNVSLTTNEFMITESNLTWSNFAINQISGSSPVFLFF